MSLSPVSSPLLSRSSGQGSSVSQSDTSLADDLSLDIFSPIRPGSAASSYPSDFSDSPQVLSSKRKIEVCTDLKENAVTTCFQNKIVGQHPKDEISHYPDNSPVAAKREDTVDPNLEQTTAQGDSPYIREAIQKTALVSGIKLTDESITNIETTLRKIVCDRNIVKEPSKFENNKAIVDSLINGSRWIDCGTKQVMILNHKLGSGDQGAVMLGITTDGEKCAIKNRKSKEKLALESEGIKQTVRSEDFYLQMLSQVPGVMRLLGVNEKHIVLEYCPTTLSRATCRLINEYVDAQDAAKEAATEAEADELMDAAAEKLISTIDNFTQEIIHAFDSIHKHGVIHGDFKLDNVMIDEEGKIKIADFGFSALEGEQLFGLTYESVPPEQANSETRHLLGKMGDVWTAMHVIVFLNRVLLEHFIDFRGEIRLGNTLELYEDYKKQISEKLNLADEMTQGIVSPEKRTNERTKQFFLLASAQFGEWGREGRESLFDRINVLTPLHEILKEMSYFDPGKRIPFSQIKQRIDVLNENNSTIYAPQDE